MDLSEAHITQLVGAFTFFLGALSQFLLSLAANIRNRRIFENVADSAAERRTRQLEEELMVMKASLRLNGRSDVD